MSYDIKYDKFFDKRQNKEVKFQELLDYLKQNNQQLGIYKNNLYCPYCKVAKLSFVNETYQKIAYLRTLRNERHEEDCIYNYDLIDIPTFTRHFKSLNFHDAQNKLNSIMNGLFKEKASNVNNGISNSKNQLNLDFIPIQLGQSKREIKYLRRRKLSSIKKDEIASEELYAFYDKEVKLELKPKKSKAGHDYNVLCIKIFSKKRDDWFTRFTMYCGQQKIDNINTELIYNIVIIGYFKIWNGSRQIEAQPFNAFLFRLAE